MVFSRKDLTDRCHNTSFVMSVPLWLTSIYGQEFDVELNGKIVLRIFKVVIFVTSKEIRDFLDRNSEKALSAAYEKTKKKIKGLLSNQQTVGGNFPMREETLNEFLIWFVIKNMTVSVETVSDILKLPSFEMLQERISQLQRALYMDRVFWQHKESLLFADLSEKIRSDFSVQIGSNACDKRWYEDWINYKLGEESVSTREKLKVRKDFSLENMDDLCDALQYDTDSKTGYYSELSDEQRKRVILEMHLIPIQFFLSTCMANNERPQMGEGETEKGDKLRSCINSIISSDRGRWDSIRDRFLLAELKCAYAQKTLSLKDTGQLSELKRYHAYVEKKYIEHGMANRDKGSPWTFSINDPYAIEKEKVEELIRTASKEKTAVAIEGISEERWQQFYDSYSIKSLHAFNCMLKKCKLSIRDFAEKESWDYSPNYSYNLWAFNEITGFVELTDAWIIHRYSLAPELQSIRISQTKQMLIECFKERISDVDGLEIINGCIGIPVQRPDKITQELLDPYMMYVTNQENWINDPSKFAPSVVPQIERNGRKLIWC